MVSSQPSTEVSEIKLIVTNLNTKREKRKQIVDMADFDAIYEDVQEDEEEIPIEHHNPTIEPIVIRGTGNMTV